MTIKNVSDFFQACLAAGLFAEEEHKSLSLAVSSRGKYKGMIRATIPAKSSPKARGVWQGVVSFCNVNRIVVGSLMIGDQEERDWYEKTENLLSERFSTRGIALILSYLEPFRWNADSPALASGHSEEEKTEVLYKIINQMVKVRNLKITTNFVAERHKHDS